MLKRVPLEYYDPRKGVLSELSYLAKKHGYKGDLGLVKYSFRRLHNYLCYFIASKFPGGVLKLQLYRSMGVRMGKNINVGCDVHIDPDWPELITIQDGVGISPRVMLIAHSRPLVDLEGFLPSFACSIVIKRGAWIGAGAIILPGVTVGEGAVVGAGSVVTKDVLPHTLVGGIPAKVIRKLHRL